LEEKRDSDDNEEEEEEEEKVEDTDEEGNVFDKLLLRTRERGRRTLIKSVDAEDKRNAQLMSSSEDTEDSSDDESYKDEQEEERDHGVNAEDETFKKRGENDGKGIRNRDNG
jgi:hypothetical protein